MAFLTTDKFYEVNFLPPTDTAWTSASPFPPGFPPGPLSRAIITTVPIVIYVMNAATGMFAFDAGQADGFSDALLRGSSMLADFTLSATNGSGLRWAKSTGGTVYLLDPTSQVLRTITPTDAGSLKTFLP